MNKNSQNSIENIYCNLLEATQKSQIDRALNEFLGLLENSPEKLLSKSQNLISLFKDKIYEYVFSKGEILEKFYLCLYAITEPNSKTDQRFEPFIRISKENLFSKGISDEENIMLLELGAIAKILSGDKNEGIKYYIRNICLIDMHTPSAQKSANFILKSFVLLQIPFETFIQAMEEVLEPENILHLDSKRRRSVFNWQLHVFWNVKHFFNHRDWLKLYPLWEKIFYATLENTDSKKIDEALYLQFFIYHMCGNSFTSQEDWKTFNQKISQKASLVYKKFAQTFSLPKLSSRTKIKKTIGFLRDRFVENSPYKVEYSFLKTLMQNEEFKKCYEIKIYLMGFLEKSDDDIRIKESYEALGIKIVNVIAPFNQDGYYNSHLSKALSIREAILKDETDILISPNNGYGISDFILASRSAPKQIFWSHGNFVYDIPEIDLKITHICAQSGALKYEGYDFTGISVSMESEFYNPSIKTDLIEKEKLKYPEGKMILGVIGRLTKIDSLPYLKSVIKIMQNFPETIFLGCGTGNVYEIKQKIASIDSEILKRFFFPGYVDSTIYGHIIDFWLDSFPMEQGESKVEFNAKGGIILNLSKENKKERKSRIQNWIEKNSQEVQKECQKSNITLETLRKIWIEDISCIAFEQDEYIKKASNILSLSKEQKQQLSNNRLLLRKIYDNVRRNNGIESFLKVIESV
ncbi:hypothetical protein BKH41_02030 [Helicobacter sp. 12S02232-10]|uniref:hypothetical protein n=1 Tax=Helicobacter sp. 12S02232-10 TaxID=1476197 RepID=UPI000BA5F31E|nr:hypothetical protein [Helicobacter sp. 12S02232-10]PAF49465.1 hypothetical protein BKH41_02030 [Helicobacter sp. 12S02232-10]